MVLILHPRCIPFSNKSADSERWQRRKLFRSSGKRKVAVICLDNRCKITWILIMSTVLKIWTGANRSIYSWKVRHMCTKVASVYQREATSIACWLDNITTLERTLQTVAIQTKLFVERK